MKKLIPLLFLASNLSVADDYSIKIFLENKDFSIESPTEINGDIIVNPTIINRGQSSNLIWNYDYIHNISIKGDIINYSGHQNKGSVVINPDRSTTYDVIVDNGNNEAKIEKQLTLTVVQPDPEITFNADKYKIGEGDSVRLNWNVLNSDSASINNGIGNISLNSFTDVSPLDDTTYTLNAIGYYGEKNLSKSLTVDVVKTSQINSFNVNKNKFTVGESALFSWNVNDSEALELKPYGVVPKEEKSQNVPLNTIGNFNYNLITTSFSGKTNSSNNININVYGEPAITSYSVNNKKEVYAEIGDDLSFSWTQSNGETISLDGNNITGNSAILKATTTKQYPLVVINGANKSVTDNVSVNIIGAASIDTMVSPSNVFEKAPFTLSWAGQNVDKYTLSSTNGSGITTNEDLGKLTSKVITPTTAGTYLYKLKAINLAEKSTENTKSIIVEGNPTFTGFTVNGSTSITVPPSSSLSFIGAGFSSGATLQGRNSGNTSNSNLPATANSTAGSTTYYASATKTLNSITRNSDIRSVSVTVVNDPTIGTITSPTPVFANASFTMNWSGTDVTNYKIKSNNANSGISTTDIDLGTSTSRAITPTSSGTYNYTITATNAAGVTTNLTRVVVVEPDPTFTGFTVNGATTINVTPTTALSFISSGFSSGSVFQARNSANNANDTLPSKAPTTFGSYNYYGSAVKSLNGQTRYSALRTVTVNVVENWTTIEPTYTAWANNGAVTGCSAWTPDPSTVTINQSFTQTRSCSQAQTRTRQNREQENYTKEIRNIGTAITENNSITVSQSQTATGTKETWVATTPTYTAWTNSGSPTGCSAWTPDPSTVNSGVAFTQTRNCSQAQTRTRQDREQETTTGAIRNTTTSTENQTISVSQSQGATGTNNPAPTINSLSLAKNAIFYNCSGDVYATVYFSASGATSLTLYPPNSSGGGQTSSGGWNVTGKTVYYPSARKAWGNRTGTFTLKACNGSSCSTRTVTGGFVDDQSCSG